MSRVARLKHDGMLFLANPKNVVQALDGRTGDLLWSIGALRSLILWTRTVGPSASVFRRPDKGSTFIWEIPG
jgi:hypothetical protein